MTSISNDWPATIAEPEATPEVLDEIRKRYRRAGNSPDSRRNLETWIDSANDVPRLLAEVARLRAELEAAAKPDPMWEHAYMDVQRVLDDALGAEEKDGAGSGIAGDVWLLAHQRDEALGKLTAITAHCRRHTEWTSDRPDALVEGLVKADDIMTIINPREETP